MDHGDSFTLPSEADGLELFAYTWQPDSPPRAVIQLVHGMAEHAQRYSPFANRLTEAGFAVYAHDQRGHGSSVPTGQNPGHLADEDGWNKAVADINQISEHIAALHPDAARILLGHSMGSFMVQQMMYEHPTAADAIILSATNGKPSLLAAAGRGVARAERARSGKLGRSPIIKALTFDDYNKRFGDTRTEFDWLSRDSEQVDMYVDDPLCGFTCTNQTWVDMLDALPRLTAPHHLALIPKTMPVYVFGGEEDPVGEMGAGLRRLVRAYQSAWMTDVSVKLYPGGRHEMLNETNRDEVMSDILDWIESVLR